MSLKQKPARPQPAAPSSPTTPYPWPLIAGVFLIALTIRAVYLYQLHDAPFFPLRFGDGASYHAWAQRIAAGDWLGQGVFYQAPLYPYFLAVTYKLFSGSILTTRLIQLLLSAASCTLLASAGVALYGRRGILAGLLLAIYPSGIFLESLVEKSALITLFLCALLLLVVTRQLPLLAGILTGLLALTRENTLLLVIPLLVWIFRPPTASSRRDALLLVAGCAAILLPVGFRNLAAGGEFHLTTSQFGSNLFIGNNPAATGLYQSFISGHDSVEYERDDVTQLAQAQIGRPLTPSEVSRYWTGEALAYIASQPLQWLQLTLRKIALTFNSAEVEDTESQLVYAEYSSLLRLLGYFDFGILLALAAFGAALTFRAWPKLWFLYAFIGVYALSTALFYIFARYRYPLVPALILLATGGLLQARQIKPIRLLIPMAAALSALLFAHIPLVQPGTGYATNYLAIANALSKDPARTAQAIEFYQRTIAVAPRWPPAHQGLGILYNNTGRPAEAIPHFQQAIATWPDFAEAYLELSKSLTATNRPNEAVQIYNEGIRLRLQQSSPSK